MSVPNNSQNDPLFNLLCVMQDVQNRKNNEDTFNSTTEIIGAKAMGSRGRVQIPKPDEKTRVGLEELGVSFGNDVDKVLVNATLPVGWQILPDERDARNRKMVNETGEKVASVWLKTTSYDYYGSTYLA